MAVFTSITMRARYEQVLGPTGERARKGDATAKAFYDSASLLYRAFLGLSTDAVNVIDDLILYIDSLETYSGELDKTLWDAIKKAKEKAEAQVRKQQEILKRKPVESYTT